MRGGSADCRPPHRRRGSDIVSVWSSAHASRESSDQAHPPDLASRRGREGTLPIRWGKADPRERGPVIGSTTNRSQRNVIGTHSGSTASTARSRWRRAALLRGHRARPHQHVPDRSRRPVPAVGRPGQDRVDRSVGRGGRRRVQATTSPQGYDIRPTIAVTKAHIDLPEVRQRDRGRAPRRRRPHPARRRLGRRHQGRDRAGVVAARRRQALRRAARPICAARCSRKPAACIPSSSRAATSRCSCRRSAARRSTCSAIRATSPIPTVTLTARVHDECNGSDVFGSDICTCRPYLTHAIEECIRGAQAGGVGPRRLLAARKAARSAR